MATTKYQKKKIEPLNNIYKKVIDSDERKKRKRCVDRIGTIEIE